MIIVLLRVVVQGQQFDEQAIKQRLERFRTLSPNPFAREITHGGQLAVDCIMDYVEAGHAQYAGVYVRGAVPTRRIEPLRNLTSFLDLLRRVNAPYPVDRLAVLVEKGMGPGNHRSALNHVFRLLAESGHDRARMLIEHHHEMARQSLHPMDIDWAEVTQGHLHTWSIAREYVTTGQGLTRPPPAALAEMREAYLEDNSTIHWECEDWTAYLDICLRRYAPHLSDSTKFVHINRRTFGQHYQALLAPALGQWIDGNADALIQYFGDEFPADSDAMADPLNFLEPFVAGMVGDEAFAVKMRLLQEQSRVSDGLLNHPVDQWLPQVVEKAGIHATAATILNGLAQLDRPLTEAESGILREALLVPDINFHWLGSDGAWTSHVSVRKLARIAPDVFRDIIGEPRLFLPVVDAIMKENLFNDRGEIYRLIEVGMGFNGDEEMSRFQARWLLLLPRHFQDEEGVSAFLRYVRRSGYEGTIYSLAEFGTNLVPAMAAAFEGIDDPVDRRLLIDALNRFRRKDRQVVDILIRGFDDPDIQVRRRAAAACRGARDAGVAAVPYLIRAMDDPDTELRRAAAESLPSVIRPPDNAHLPDLLRLLEHEDPYVRRQVIRALNPYADHSELIMPIFRQLLVDEDADVALQAAREVRYFEGRAADGVTIILDVLNDERAIPQVKIILLSRIASFRRSVAESRIALEGLLDDPDPGVRERAGATLKMLTD